MNLKDVTEQITANNNLRQQAEIDLKDIDPDVPTLQGYEDLDWTEYLARQDIYPTNSLYETFKSDLQDKYKKRQDLLNSIAYYTTYNLILQAMIEFYQDNLMDPTESELTDLSDGLGTAQHISEIDAEIMSLFL